MANAKKSGWFKWLLLVLVVGGGAVGFWHYRNREQKEPEYQTIKVTRGDITQAVTATGQLNPVLNVQVGSQISGIIQKLYADFNSTVRSNQVVAQLDPATFQANVHSAEGDLANAKAGLELAQVEARRSESLFADRLIAQADYDKAIATLHQAEAQVKIREASLERAKVDLARCTIYSPVDGIVISRNVDVGQTVAASMSAPTLFIIANDLTKMQIDANVAEADVGGVEIGQAVEFTVDAFPLRTFHGKVIQVRNSPITVQNVVTYDTVIEVSNPDLKLKPGMTANVSIITARRENVLRVLNSAFRFRPPDAPPPTNATPAAIASTGPPGGGGGGEGVRPEGGRRRGPGGPGGQRTGGSGRAQPERQLTRTVYVLSKANPGGSATKPEPVSIKVGISDGVNTEVSAGLNEGDLVVTGVMMNESSSSSQGPTNPFGGGFRRRF